MAHPNRTHPAGFTVRRGPVCFLTACLLIVGLTVLPNCSEKKDYKTLSFFFDGVPDPNAPPEIGPDGQPIANSTAGGTTRVFSIHKPYKDNKCDDCHVGNVTRFESFAQLTDSVCMKCHQQVPGAFTYMHGPVASGACLMCHDPHEASQAHLLKVAPPDLCLQCHQREDLGPPTQAHADLTASCLDCHVGHGSNRHGLLRDVAVLGPTGTPVNDPAQPPADPGKQPAPTPPPADPGTTQPANGGGA